MRPKLLEIEGLQSFSKMQRIDFDALGEAGLFGIFGPTGSGKSTVLDAVTLALYGRVKRADGTQGIINTNMNTAKVSFTFEIMKDSMRKNFRVERLYQRKKGSANSCDPKLARLVEIAATGEIPICDRATDVNNYIRDLLGLSNEDFTRAVVLPQNSFHEFLLLGNLERRRMIERVFYMEEYGKKLLEKLNRKMSEVQSRLDFLSGELKGYEDASQQALVEAKKAAEESIAERSRVEKEFRQLNERYNEEKEIWQLVQEQKIIEEKSQEHRAKEELTAIKRIQLERALKAEGMLEMIRKSKELRKKYEETVLALEETLKIIPGTAESLNKNRQQYNELKAEASTEQPRLVAAKTKLESALAIKSEINSLDKKITELELSLGIQKQEFLNKSKIMQKVKSELDGLQNDINRLRLEEESLKTDPEYRHGLREGEKLENETKTMKKQMKELMEKTTGIKKVLVELEQKLEVINKDILFSKKGYDELKNGLQGHEISVPEDRNQVLKYLENVNSINSNYEILTIKKSELDGTKQKIDINQAALDKLSEKLRILENNSEKAGIYLKQCKTEIDCSINEMNKNAARVLAKNLKNGEPCPVCGSEHHPNPAVHSEDTGLEILEKRIEEATEKYNRAEKEYKEAEKTFLLNSEQAKALKNLIEQLQYEYQIIAEEYEMFMQKLPEELRGLAPHQIKQQLDIIKRMGEEKLRAFEVWEKKLEEYNKKLQEQNENISGKKISEKGLLTEIELKRDVLKQLERDIAEKTVQLNEKQYSYLDFLKQHKIEGAAAELERLAGNDRKLNTVQKQMEEMQIKVNEKRSLLEIVNQEIQKANIDRIEAENTLNYHIEQKNEKQRKILELSADAEIEEKIKKIDAKLYSYIDVEKKYNEKVQELEKLHNSLINNKSLLINQKEIFWADLQEEESAVQKTIKERGFNDMEEVEGFFLPTEKQKALKDEIGEYDRTDMNIRAQKEIVQKKLKSRMVTEEEWNSTSFAYNKMAAYKEECISKSEIDKNNLKNLKIKHEKWIEISRNYKELGNKQSLFEQIQKLLRANSFIDYIAEDRLRYVAAKASETLGIMTDYRYVLELDADSGFVIRDNANGGVHRAVNSLSGGETFLTALSLALALSDHIQLKGQSPLEFFFLDEGFGMLDNNLLDNVIDSLERLSRKERVIGIISHVPELRARISRRLIVEPPTPQGEGSKVRIEKG